MPTPATKRPTLMLLPGLLCDGTVFAAARARLIDVADVIVPRFLGFDSIATMAESVLAQAPARFSVAGFSMGGRVAFQIAHVALKRLDRFCVFDTGSSAAAPGEDERRKKLVDLGYEKGMAAVAEAWLPTMIHPTRAKEPAFLKPLIDMVCRATPDAFARQSHALLTRADATPVLPTIRCPALVMCGAQDASIPPETHKAIAAAIPGAELKVVENSGHFLPTEQPVAFADALRGWLAKPV